MKAAFIKQYGEASNLEIGQLDKPAIKANQVLIRVVASGVNPVDFHLRKGMMAQTDTHTLPLVLGWDCSGIIESIGSEVESLALGDKVLSFTPISGQGTNAEFVAVDAELVVKKPDDLSFVEAAGLPLASVTAWQGLHHHGRLQRGNKVLIHNASGAVGAFAVQLAKAEGAHVIATASEAKLEYIKSLGADEVYDEQSSEWHASMRYDLAFVAKPGVYLLHRTVSCVKSGGVIVSTFDELAEGEVGIYGIAFTRMWVENSGQNLEHVVNLIKENKLKVPIDTVYPLEDIQSAHRRSEQYQAVGKIVLVIDPTRKF